MKKNSLLSLAGLVCKALAGFLIISFLLITGFLVYWHLNPGFYSDVPFPDLISHDTAAVTINVTDKQWPSETAGEEKFLLKNVLLVSVYLSYLQLSAILLFSFLSLKEFLKVLRSVNMIQTFQKQNVDSFRRIGKYMFIVFFLSSFLLVFAEQGNFFGFYLHITPLLLMLLAFVMAEVFKEGNNLYEENLYTV